MNKEKLKPTDPEAALRRKLAWQLSKMLWTTYMLMIPAMKLMKPRYTASCTQKPDEGGEKNDMTIQ